MRAVVDHYYAIVQRRAMNVAGPPPAEGSACHADSIGSPLLVPSDSLGSHDITDEDKTTYREELLILENEM